MVQPWFNPGPTLSTLEQPWFNRPTSNTTDRHHDTRVFSTARRSSPCAALRRVDGDRTHAERSFPTRPGSAPAVLRGSVAIIRHAMEEISRKTGVRIARCSEVRRGALHKCVHGSACDGGVDGADGPHTHGAVFVSRAPRAAVKGIRNKPCNLRCNLRPAARRRVPQTS